MSFLSKLNPITYIKDFFTVRFIKSTAEKLATQGFLNGKKTETGIVVTLLGFILMIIPEQGQYIQPVIDALQPYAVEVTLAGFVQTVWGYIHSLIKKVKGKESVAE
jgi:hypothetical protein